MTLAIVMALGMFSVGYAADEGVNNPQDTVEVPVLDVVAIDVTDQVLSEPAVEDGSPDSTGDPAPAVEPVSTPEPLVDAPVSNPIQAAPSAVPEMDLVNAVPESDNSVPATDTVPDVPSVADNTEAVPDDAAMPSTDVEVIASQEVDSVAPATPETDPPADDTPAPSTPQDDGNAASGSAAPSAEASVQPTQVDEQDPRVDAQETDNSAPSNEPTGQASPSQETVGNLIVTQDPTDAETVAGNLEALGAELFGDDSSNEVSENPPPTASASSSIGDIERPGQTDNVVDWAGGPDASDWECVYDPETDVYTITYKIKEDAEGDVTIDLTKVLERLCEYGAHYKLVAEQEKGDPPTASPSASRPVKESYPTQPPAPGHMPTKEAVPTPSYTEPGTEPPSPTPGPTPVRSAGTLDFPPGPTLPPNYEGPEAPGISTPEPAPTPYVETSWSTTEPPKPSEPTKPKELEESAKPTPPTKPQNPEEYLIRPQEPSYREF